MASEQRRVTPHAAQSSQLWQRADFDRQARDAVAHLYDVAYLQTHPLANLARTMPGASELSAGPALRQALLDAVERLRPSVPEETKAEAWRGYHILRLHYVDGQPIDAVQAALAISRSTYYREVHRALQAVHVLLWEQWGLNELGDLERGELSASAAVSNQSDDWSQPRPSRDASDHRSSDATLRRPAPPRHNLPVPVTSFVGRARERALVAQALATTRLLTLTGTGGCGKTRLAQQVAADLLAHFPDGVWFVDLAPLATPNLVAPTVAAVLGVRERTDQLMDALLQQALAQQQVLLVLDNCEHLIEASATLAEALLRRCPELRILATSREPLRIAGEAVWRVPSLTVPELASGWITRSVIAVASAEAAQLLVDRTRAFHPTFTIDDANAMLVARICRQLEGIPLAIELAAARLGTLSLTEVAKRLDDRFHLLTEGSRTVLPRHRTLRAAVDWSYDLLTEQERIVLRRLSVFAGGWALEAAEEVCGGEGIALAHVLDLLTHLVDKSLVQFEARQGGDGRYRLLEVVRQYARERLLATDEAEAVRRRHALHYLALAERAAPHLLSAGQAPWFTTISLAYDNMRLALGWAVEQGEIAIGLRLGVALNTYWQMALLPAEGKAWLTRLLVDHSPDHARPSREVQALRTRALLATGALAWRAGDPDAGRPWLEEALVLACELDDQPMIANAVKNLAISVSIGGDQGAARPLFEEALARGRAVADLGTVAVALLYLGQIARFDGELARARAYLQESHTLRQSLGPEAEAGALEGLAMVALDAGDHALARSLLREGLRLVASLGATYRQSVLVACWACLAAADGHPAQAHRLFRAATAANETLGRGTRTGLYRSFFDRHLAPARRLAASEATAAIVAHDRPWPLADCVAALLTEPPAPHFA